MKLKIFLIVTLNYFFCNLSFSDSAELGPHAHFYKNHVVKIETKNEAGKFIQVEVDEMERPKNCVYGGFWGQREKYPPAYLVSDVRVKFGEKNIPVALSAYMDLSEPTMVEVEFQKENWFCIVISGAGCSSCGYRAALTFKDDVLAERKVFSEDWENLWEETFYSLVQGATNK